MTLLDTNVVIYVLKRNKAVAQRFAERVGDMAIPAMVYGELLYGVARSQNPARNAELLENLIDALPVLHTNDAIMQAFATQKAALAARGELVEDADLRMEDWGA